MPTLTQLKYALALLKTKHFGKAAELCHVTQPTLSMQIQKLEQTLQTPLFDRDHTPLISTEKGARLLAQMRIILEETERLLHLSSDPHLSLQGPLRVGVLPTISPYLVPLFLKHFLNACPKTLLFLEEMKTQHILKALEEGSLDAGIVATPIEGVSIKKKVLFYEPFYFFSHPSHPLFQKKRLLETDLSLHDIWILEEGHCFRDQVLTLCRNRKTSKKPWHVSFESGSFETLKHLVSKHFGYTLLPYLCVFLEKNPNYKKLIRSFHAPIPSREISLIYTRKDWRTQKRETLASSILQTLPKPILEMQKKLKQFHILKTPPIQPPMHS